MARIRVRKKCKRLSFYEGNQVNILRMVMTFDRAYLIFYLLHLRKIIMKFLSFAFSLVAGIKYIRIGLNAKKKWKLLLLCTRQPFQKVGQFAFLLFHSYCNFHYPGRIHHSQDNLLISIFRKNIPRNINDTSKGIRMGSLLSYFYVKVHC